MLDSENKAQERGVAEGGKRNRIELSLTLVSLGGGET